MWSVIINNSDTEHVDYNPKHVTCILSSFPTSLKANNWAKEFNKHSHPSPATGKTLKAHAVCEKDTNYINLSKKWGTDN